MANGQNRSDIRPGLEVDIVLKQDQRTGKLTRGVVKDILTNSPHHSRGIKVRLRTARLVECSGRIDVGNLDETSRPTWRMMR